ncbi:hypothetical protein [Hymenobacter terricola]|uniref:hypothetical protein n=1 Tax=Hymenobacter terricola TaxID=2819236 RepID=UPI001B315D5C|nr:hypothetical protein [Hymenobacter terricola]
MPKLIDYPRTSYTGAWELAEVTDDTGGKCAIDTAARKLNRKVSGSFKAIIGSAVKFGLLTSKRELLTTTTLFKRIKHAYDKQEELVFHREAFLTPPLFTQLCRKFRSRELPIQMLDVMLIREFGVEEINAQGVAKAFVDGARMVGLLNENNVIADIDTLAAQQTPRRELASPQPSPNTFRQEPQFLPLLTTTPENNNIQTPELTSPAQNAAIPRPPATEPTKTNSQDAIASLFGLLNTAPAANAEQITETARKPAAQETELTPFISPRITTPAPALPEHSPRDAYQIQVSGPGVNTTLSITEEDDVAIAIALLEKIRRQLKA